MITSFKTFRGGKSSRLLRRCICTVLGIFLLFGTNVYAAPESADKEIDNQYLDGIMDMIRDEYQGSPNGGQVVEGAVKGMFGSLDNYTTYYNTEEAEAFFSYVTGVFGGIGVTMEASGDYIIVTEVYPGSPAEKAGIQQGDKIVEADGVSLVKATMEEAASVIRGEKGTKVNLGILRDGSDSVMKIDVMREIIKINPVVYEFRNDGVGYIKLGEFNENADEFLTKALEDMDRKKVKKIILDLRDNPGGEVDQAVAVAEKFVPEGLITKLDYKSEKYSDIEYNSHLKKLKYKLAVLVNGMSASASEIVAGAVQDSGAGKLVGTKTFGKAKFQGLIPILTPEAFAKYEKELGIKAVNAFDLQIYNDIVPEDSEIAGYAKMTLGLYYTPKGRMIDGTGLAPDVEAAAPKLVDGVPVESIGKLSKTTEPGLNSGGIDVYNAEKILKILGYKKGSPDTKLDSETASAIKAYQKASGIAAGGTLDSRTQTSLNKSRLELIEKYDTQYAEAAKLLKS